MAGQWSYVRPMGSSSNNDVEITCPFDKTHTVPQSHLQLHIDKYHYKEIDRNTDNAFQDRAENREPYYVREAGPFKSLQGDFSADLQMPHQNSPQSQFQLHSKPPDLGLPTAPTWRMEPNGKVFTGAPSTPIWRQWAQCQQRGNELQQNENKQHTQQVEVESQLKWPHHNKKRSQLNYKFRPPNQNSTSPSSPTGKPSQKHCFSHSKPQPPLYPQTQPRSPQYQFQYQQQPQTHQSSQFLSQPPPQHQSKNQSKNQPQNQLQLQYQHQSQYQPQNQIQHQFPQPTQLPQSQPRYQHQSPQTQLHCDSQLSPSQPQPRYQPSLPFSQFQSQSKPQQQYRHQSHVSQSQPQPQNQNQSQKQFQHPNPQQSIKDDGLLYNVNSLKIAILHAESLELLAKRPDTQLSEDQIWYCEMLPEFKKDLQELENLKLQ